MTEALNYMTPDGPRDFVNRKTGLTVAGVIMIIMGSIAGCFSILTPVAIIAAQNLGQPAMGGGMQARAAAMGCVIYVAVAAGLIWGGIGAVKAKRWIRPLVLIFGTLLLLIGVAVIIGTIVSLKSIGAQMQVMRPPNAPAMPAGVMYAGVIAAVLVSLVIYVVIPGIYVWFFRREEVRKTLEFYDPVVRWTDRCPLPVLGMSVACAVFAAGTLCAVIYLVMPVFGVILTGGAAGAAILLVAALLGTASALIYQRKLTGWWLAVLVLVILQVSAIVTAFRVDASKLYAAMGMTEEQTQFMQFNMWTDPVLTCIMGAVVLIAVLAYALCVRKYFATSPQDATQGSPA